MGSQIYQLTSKTPITTDLIPVQDYLGGADAKKVPLSALQTLLSTQTVSVPTLEGTDDTTTAVLIYGVNRVDTSTGSDFCARLPLIPVEGRTVTVVNTSSFIARIFPSVTGGKINGVVDGHYDVLPDSLPYSFVCYENPNPGNWAASGRPQTNTIVISEMSVVHVNGVADFYVGVGTPISSGIGGGVAGSPSHLVLTPASQYWRSENIIAQASKLNVYTNIIAGKAVDDNGFIGYLYQCYMDGAGSATSGQRSEMKFGSTYNEASLPPYINSSIVNSGVLNSPIAVGDIGTFFGNSTINGGSLGTGSNIGIGGTYSRYYYTFAISIAAATASGTYKFRFELEYV
jgi:hypothetical protein